MLEIRLLGTPVITRDERPVEVDTRKAIAMLAYLAVEKSAHRDSIATLLWGDAPPDRARATLRRTLSALRSGVGPDNVEANRDRVTLGADVHSDLDQVDSELAATRDHDHDPGDVCPRCLPHLERAATLYRGDFLGAFSVKGAPDFEDWARTVAESRRLEAGGVFQRLAYAHAAAGDYSSAIATVTRWIDLDELHEPAHRLLMLLNAWAGDRPGSIQAYRDCVAVLDRELGVAPLEETTELHEAILDEDLPPAPGLRRTVRSHETPEPPRPTALLDRTAETGRIGEHLSSLGDAGRVVFLLGESWMGKTRLIEHAHHEADDKGFISVAARGYRTERRLPYGVANQVISALANVVGEEGALPDWAEAELHRIDPRATPADRSGEARFGKLRLREALVALVEAGARRRRVLISIDDAQWVDSASAGLIAFAARRSAGPIMWLLARRTGDEMNPALDELLDFADDSISLRPLTQGDIPDDDQEIDVGEVIRETGGIPLLVQEALDLTRPPTERSTASRYMESRLSGVSELGRQVMAAASVLSGMCDANLLRETSGRTEEEVVEAVEELIGLGILVEHEDGRLTFGIAALEPLVYEEASLIRRRLLHRRAAGAIQDLPRSRTDPRLATAVAEHMRRSGDDQAASWFRLAGDLARDLYAPHEAAAAYEMAIALGSERVDEVRLALGELAMARGEYETAMRELRAAASQSEGATLAVIEHRIGDVHRILGRFALAEESFSRAEPSHPRLAELFADWALLRHRTGDQEEAIRLAQRAADDALSRDDVRALSRSLNILGVVASDDVAAVGHLDRALELAGGDELARMAALNNKAHRLSQAGDGASARTLVTEAIDIARRGGYRHHHAALLNHLADIHHAQGREAEAGEALTEAVQIFSEVDAGEWEPELWLLRQW